MADVRDCSLEVNEFELLYCHLQIHIYIYMQHHNDILNKQTQEDFFRKICTSHFIQGFMVRGSWRPNRNCNILTPLLWPSALCLSRSPDAQPEVQRPTLLGDGFLYCILSASSLDPKIQSGAPSPFGLVWLSLPHLVYNSVRSLTGTSVLTELYNSPTSTQSPTRFLELHV